MARKTNFSTDELIQLLETYVSGIHSFNELQVVKVAQYCRDVLNIPNITYQNFTRNKEIKEWIADYNKKIHARVINTGDSIIFPENMIDVNDAIRRYKNTEEMKEFLSSINRQMSKQNDLCRTFSSQYQDCEKDLSELQKSKELLEQQVNDLNEKLKCSITENKRLRKENKSLRKQETTVKKYLDRYIYSPNLCKHLRDIGIIVNDEDNNENEGSDLFLDGMYSFSSDIRRFYESTREEEQVQGQQKYLNEKECEEQIEISEPFKVLSSKENKLLDKFADL